MKNEKEIKEVVKEKYAELASKKSELQLRRKFKDIRLYHHAG